MANAVERTRELFDPSKSLKSNFIGSPIKTRRNPMQMPCVKRTMNALVLINLAQLEEDQNKKRINKKNKGRGTMKP